MCHRVRGRSESGASAVEFALVSPILFLVLFGILQYGLWFNDSINERQGVREAARMAVVENFTLGGCTTGDNAVRLACMVRQQVAPTNGTAYAKVVGPVGTAWTRGTPLVVCAAVKEGNIGILPMPSGGWMYAKLQMSIEQDLLKSSWPTTLPADSASGLDWSAAGC